MIENLTVSYGADRPAVSNVSLSVEAGQTLALVGESGSGKSTVAATTMGLLSPAGEITGGSVQVCGSDVVQLSPRALRSLRGNRIALIPQEAMSALDPVQRIGDQLVEAVLTHTSCSRRDARTRAVHSLELVGIDPARIGAYPHELSGGMRQRVVIAIALANDPVVLVADEPTSGLDVLVEDDILGLLEHLQNELGLAVLLVSHNLPAVERIADTIAVMHDGTIVEMGSTRDIIDDPQHPYTRRLISSVVRMHTTTAKAVIA
jgi:peptide/nickel transport system ATP-binding protein